MKFTETDNGTVRFISQAIIIDDDTEIAWAEKYIRSNDHHGWILGKYVEADQANLNRQFFELEDLRESAGTLVHAPLNIGHAYPPVGAFVATELLYPETADDGAGNPFLEALSVMWKSAFPVEFKAVEAAYKAGKLAYSMEAKPSTVTCGGDHGCGQTFEYAGRTDPTYCSHINKPTTDTYRVLNKPDFTGGALIIPPVMPGWANADVTQVASRRETSMAEQEETYDVIAEEFAHLSPSEWEAMMLQITGEYSK